MDRYRALALQVACHAVNRAATTDAARGVVRDNIERIATQIRAAKRYHGDQLKLVVLPEYVLTGFPMGEPFPDWIARACISSGGPELDILAQACVDAEVYVCLNAYDTDENFPGLYFQSNFVLSDTGEQILRYRRLNSMFAPTPHDVLDDYLEIYGVEGLFPVADTPIGRLATIASEEILYPEIARAHAVLGGAEVFLHPTSEVGSPAATPKAITRRARAVENLAYVVSANTAGLYGTDIPSGSTDAMSIVLDPEGRILAEAGPGETIVTIGEIDLAALRARRGQVAMGNTLARQRLELFQPVYASGLGYPANTLAGVTSPQRSAFVETQRQTIQMRRDRGLL